MPKPNKKSGEPGWRWRKALIFPLVAFACWRLMSLESAQDTKVNETIAWGWICIIGAMSFFFTGFATIQDISAILATKSGLPYSPGANKPSSENGTE